MVVELHTGFLLLSLLINAIAAGLARLKRSISNGGSVAATLIGMVILYAGGFFLWGLLMLFFVTSTLASRIGSARKTKLEKLHEKGSQRDVIQVIANGGVPAVCALLLGFTGNITWAVAAAAALASANADTWGSELGVLSSRPPRSIVTGRVMPPGTSGGISMAGTLASVAGAAIVALWMGLGLRLGATSRVAGDGLGSLPAPHAWTIAIIVLVAGTLGSLVDSVLGATIQAEYQTSSGERTERRSLGGIDNLLVKGFRVVTNDIVNLANSLIAAAAGFAAVALIG